MYCLRNHHWCVNIPWSPGSVLMPLIFPPCSFSVLGSYSRCHTMFSPHMPFISSGLWQAFRILLLLWPWQFWGTMAWCFIEHTMFGGVWWFSHNGAWVWGTKPLREAKAILITPIPSCLIASVFEHGRGWSVISTNFELNSVKFFNPVFLPTLSWHFLGKIWIWGRRVGIVGTGDLFLCFNSVCFYLGLAELISSDLGLKILVWSLSTCTE